MNEIILPSGLLFIGIFGMFVAGVVGYAMAARDGNHVATSLRIEIGNLAGRLDDAERRETYWRERAEKLTDAALIRAGATSEQVMENPTPDPNAPSIDTVIAAMGRMETP